MIIVDTGPLYAAADVRDAHHAACVRELENTTEQLVVPISVVIETTFLIERNLGSQAEAAFLSSLVSPEVRVEHLEDRDIARMAELVVRYADLPLGSVDASVIAVVERLGVTTVLTVDRRDFTVVRPRHIDTFTLLP